MTITDHRPYPTALVDEQLLLTAAEQVLEDNWLGTSTVPSHGLYPHQWSWDSAFIAIGTRHRDPQRAQQELTALFGAQWPDGRVPHIVFHPATPPEAYFPGPDFWCAETRGLQTSGLVQPPVHALAAWLTHLADPVLSRRNGFLSTIYPALVAWHEYLMVHRGLGGTGLASIVHPWESGMDNSPCWDPPLSRVTPTDPSCYRRRDLDHAAAADRPSEQDYGRYVRLATDYRDAGYRDRECDFQFLVEDPAFNALLARSERALAAIATELGDRVRAARHRAAAQAITRALTATLWDPARAFFFPRDVRAGARITEYSCTGLIPLVLPDLAVSPALLSTARGSRFRLGTVHGVPSYDLTAPGFDSGRYWRGPSWFNVGWLVCEGLAVHGETRMARQLRAELTTLAARTQFAEYIDPVTGEGHGARNFSWTAALTIDLLRR